MNRIILVVVFLCGMLFACQDKWEDYYKQGEGGTEGGSVSASNLLEYLKSQAKYSQFVKLLEETGVAEELTRNQILTVWAPTDETMPEAKINAMSMEDKATLCKNHINYIALYNTKLENDKIIKSLAGKNLVLQEPVTDKFVIDGVEVEEAEQGCSNGVIHEVKGWILPRLNLYEHMLRAGADYSIYRDSILAHSDTIFKPSQSFVVGTDSLGNTIYDSVFVIENTLFKTADIRNEDKEYSLFLPSDRVIKAMYTEMYNYFTSIGKVMTAKDSTSFINWIVRASIYEGLVEHSGTLKSVFGTEWRSEFQQVSPAPGICSNGLVYEVEKIHIPKYIYLQSIKAYPYYLSALPDEDLPNHVQASTGKVEKERFTTMEGHQVMYVGTSYKTDFWVEFDAFIKDEAGNVIQAFWTPGIYTIKVSHRTYKGGKVEMYVNDEYVTEYNASNGIYSWKAGLVKDRFEVGDDWGNKPIRMRWVNVGGSDRVCIEYVLIEPSQEDNY